MNTLADKTLAWEATEDLNDIFARYPGIDRILTPEKITAYDRGGYDDLDALLMDGGLVDIGELAGTDTGTIVKWHDLASGNHRYWRCALARRHPNLDLRARQYEAEIISRYKAGLL